MFEIHEIETLPVGDSLTKTDRGFEVTLTRNFFDGSQGQPRLSLVITPENMRSDDEWVVGVNSDQVNERIKSRLKMHLSS